MQPGCITDSSVSGEEFQMLQLQMPMGMPFITEKWQFQLILHFQPKQLKVF